ncbi:MAG: HpcH/HpaI aldolase/citrate lyase family protein [Actinomycetota bacterium]|nr:HpcH/HpaI aldolase/citrate lyase family protein [Actinomycetota bacterium]
MADLPPNQFKHRLAAGETLLGLWVALADTIAAEIAAGAGFDWLVVDGEHAPNDLRTTLHQLQALAAYDAEPVVRPVIGDAAGLKQLCDIGTRTFLVPMVESADQARDLVAAISYPPAGYRGMGTGLARAARWNRIEGYAAKANDEMCLLVQIETQAGLDALDDIVAVDGVDGVFIGPSDLSASTGYPGRANDPEVVAMVGDAIERIAEHKPAGVLAADLDIATEYRNRGARFIAVGSDTGLLARATDHLHSDATHRLVID